MKQKFIALMTAGVLTSVTLVTVASPARADNAACPADRFCLFESVNFLGGRAVFSNTDTDLRNNFWEGGSGRSVHDSASSMINNTGRRVILFADVGCAGTRFYVASPESADTTFRDNNFNDVADCVDFV
jgi:hypothetical protein